MLDVVDVLIVGAGPAGRAVAAACSDTGLDVSVVAPAPRNVWPHTYGSWLDELPTSVPRSALAAVTPVMRAIGTTEHELDRAYAGLDNTALWKHLWRSDVEEVTEGLLRSSLRRTLDAIERMVELRAEGRPARRAPGPACRWCSLAGECEPGRAHLGVVDG